MFLSQWKGSDRAGRSYVMTDLVKVGIEVSPEAAELLKDDERRRAFGELISRSVMEPLDELRSLIREIKADARAAGLTDEDIDAELEAYNAERRA